MKMVCLWSILGLGVATSTQVSGAGGMQGQVQSVEVPAGERLALAAEGRGVQVYRCEKAGEGTAWVFVAPEASLSVNDMLVGTHGAGPIWTHQDGSTVTGEVVAKVVSPATGALPLLLLRASGHAGNPKGLFAAVNFIQRLETISGVAPAGACEAGASLRVPYSAVYLFYVAADSPVVQSEKPQGRR